MPPFPRTLTVLCVFAFAFHGASPLPVRIGVPAGESGLETIRGWSVLNDYLRGRGVDAAFEVLEDNRAVVGALRDRFIDLGFLDPLWYLRVRESLSPLVEVGAGPRGFTVFVAVPKNSIAYRLEDLSGASFALPSREETAAGHCVPLAMLSQAGIRTRDLGKIIYAETDLSVLKGVAYGDIGAGGFSSALSADDRYVKLFDEVRVIAESAPLPPSLLAIRREDGGEKYRRLREELVAMGVDPQGREKLGEAGFPGFFPPSLKDYGTLERYLQVFEAAHDAEN